MIDTTKERLIRLVDVPSLVKWLPRGRRGDTIKPSTLAKWGRVGKRGVKLEIETAIDTCTSEDALRRFFARLREPAADRTELDVAVGHANAERFLDSMGVGAATGEAKAGA